MTIPLRVLILEDRSTDAELIAHELRRANFDLTWQRVETETEFCAALDPTLDVILADYSLPQYDANRALRCLQERKLDIPFIVVTGSISEEVAVDMMKLGATDYLLKDRTARLPSSITNALEQKRLREEKRRADQALRESEERFRALVERSQDAIALAGPDGTILYASPGAGRIVGVRPEAMIGHSTFERIHPEDLLRAKEIFDQALEQPGATLTSQFRIQRLDGTWRWIEGVGTNMLHVPGVRAMVANYRDITERKHAEEALRLSETQYRTLIEQASDGIFITDRQGRYHDVNTSGCAMLGYARKELLTMDWTYILLPEAITQDPPNIGALSAGKTIVRERIYKRKDGSVFPVEISAKMLSDGRIQNIVRDITERKRAEEERQHRAEQMAILNLAAIKLQQCFNPQEIVQAACDELQQLGTFASFYGITDDGQKLQHLHTSMSDEMLVEYIETFGQAQLQFSIPVSLIAPLWGQLKEGKAIIDSEFAPKILATLPTETRPIGEWILMRSKQPAMLLAPITRDGATTGLITVLGDGWGASDLSSVTLFARHVSVALENARLFDERRRRLLELEAINKISTALRRAQTINEMLPILLQETLAALDAATGTIWLYDSGRDALVQVGELNFPHFPSLLTPQQGIAGHVFSSGKPYLSPEFKSDPLTVVENRAEIPDGLGGACVPILASDQVIGVLFVSVFLPRQLTPDEIHLLTTIAEIAGNAIHRTRLHEQSQQDAIALTLAYDKTIEGWSHALDLRDKETEGHSQRVTEMTLQLARAMRIPDAELTHIRRGALLHDIGKMGVPDSVLLKPGTLNEREWEIMRRHPEYAKDLLAPIDFLQPALDIPYCHHEKWDGTGYPRGLRGEEIPLAARIFAVVDVWDALRADRPYRSAWSQTQARDYIRVQSGKHFDPQVVEAFLEL